MNQALKPDISAPANLSAGIYSDLQRKLIVGDLRPAENLSIRTLAEEYKVSAMPVREALRQLASEDALIGAAKKAYRVPNLTSEQAADLFFVRAVLEGAAAEIAAERVSEADIKILRKHNIDLEAAWGKQHASDFLFANYQFHRHVYSLTGNSALQSMIDALYVRTGPWLAYGITNLVKPDKWMGEHDHIITALGQRDKAETRRLMEEDARWGVELFRELG
ncbi:GntR family transcriptional regulator [uncultured Roseovarius sp.]|uniref:GntR family transcriptional regulator n=1 Tax=uncultured Roseovarius sp. TaxID=293344 RepID=UPI002630E6D2|nr:GntR family transcriptional regulator [uncultured Roseovarius sp.]